MKFEKGYDPRRNTRGRPHGAKNVSTAEFRQLVTVTASDFFPKIIEALYKLDDDKKVQYGLRLLEFVIPKMKESDMTIQIEKLTPSQLDQLADYLLKDTENE